jgi:origin recognition complex subunit 4
MKRAASRSASRSASPVEEAASSSQPQPPPPQPLATAAAPRKPVAPPGLSLSSKVTLRTQTCEPVGLGPQIKVLADLLGRVMDGGENHSVLVTGPRGAGKSLLVEHVIRVACPESACVVRLHGALLLDDTTAIRDLARQMALEAEMDSLGLVSFAESLSFVIEGLRALHAKGRATIVVLDELDRFAERGRQTLLYNLLDLASSPEARLAVVGISARLDAMELLEKRVQSRFSNRYVHCPLPATAENMVALLTSVLSLPDEPAFTESLPALFQNATVQAMVRENFVFRSDPRWFLNLFSLAVRLMGPGETALTAAHLFRAQTCVSADSQALLVQGISVLELCLLIAMNKLEEKRHVPYHFEMVYAEYTDFARGLAGASARMEAYSRSMCTRGMERLVELGFVTRPESRTTRKEFQPVRILLDPEQVTAAIQKFPDCPGAVKQWGCKWMS